MKFNHQILTQLGGDPIISGIFILRIHRNGKSTRLSDEALVLRSKVKTLPESGLNVLKIWLKD